MKSGGFRSRTIHKGGKIKILMLQNKEPVYYSRGTTGNYVRHQGAGFWDSVKSVGQKVAGYAPKAVDLYLQNRHVIDPKLKDTFNRTKQWLNKTNNPDIAMSKNTKKLEMGKGVVQTPYAGLVRPAGLMNDANPDKESSADKKRKLMDIANALSNYKKPKPVIEGQSTNSSDPNALPPSSKAPSDPVYSYRNPDYKKKRDNLLGLSKRLQA